MNVLAFLFSLLATAAQSDTSVATLHLGLSGIPEGIYERATDTNPVARSVYRELELQVQTTAVLAEKGQAVAAVGMGVVGTAGGMTEMGAGVVLFLPSFGASSVFILHGVDVTQANVRQTFSAEFTPTFTYQTISEAGYPTTALVVDVGISLSGGISAAGLTAEGSLAIRGIGSTVRVVGPQTIIPVSVRSPTLPGVRSLPVLNEAFTPNASTVLQRLTATTNARLGQNLRLATTVLRQPDYRLGQISPRMFPAEYGRALEKLVAAHVGGDPLLNQVFRYTGSGHGPDFVGTGSALGLEFDITTETARSIAGHRARSYGKDLILITYQRSLDLKVFPP